MRALRQLRSFSHESDRTAALLVSRNARPPFRISGVARGDAKRVQPCPRAGARRRFGLGYARAAALIRLRALADRPTPGTANSRAFVFVGIAAALCLATYGLVHYPGLRSEPRYLGFGDGSSLSSLQATR